jgi:hypothetical protein
MQENATNFETYELKLERNDGEIVTVSIPYRSIGTTTRYEKKAWLEEPILPSYITCLDPDRQKVNGSEALTQMRQERGRAFQAACGIVADEYVAHLRMSDQVPEGHYWLDPQGLITVNEKWANENAKDADGDAGSLKSTVDKMMAVFKKWPLVHILPVLKRILVKPRDTWFDLTERPAPADNTVADEYALFSKCHAANDVGIKTNYFDGKELFEAVQKRESGAKFADAIAEFLEDNNRFRPIEGELKKFRNEDVAAFELPEEGIQPPADLRFVYMGKKEVSPEGLFGNDARNWKQFWDEAIELDCFNSYEFAPFKTALKVRDPEVRRKANQGTPNLTGRLIKIRALDVERLPHRLFPNGVVKLSLHRYINGNRYPVALEDNKRGKRRTYEFYVPPIVSVQNGQVIWQDGQEALEEAIGHIWPYVDDGSRWPKNHAAFTDYPQKTSMLISAITQFVGRYGIAALEGNDWVEVDGDENRVSASMALPIASRAFTIQYGSFVLDKMWSEWCTVRDWFEKNTKFSPSIAADKQPTELHRMHAVCHRGTDVPLWTAPHNNGKRATEIKKQVGNSLPLGHYDWENRAWRRCKSTVFVYSGEGPEGQIGTTGQLYCFPSGADQMDVENMFLERVYHTREDSSPFEELTPVEFVTLQGQLRKCWVGGPRTTLACGKIVMPCGVKNFSGVENEQLVASTGGERRDVDFALSVQEICAKGAQKTFFDRAVPAVVQWGDKTVKGYLATVQLYRTCSFGDNVTPRVKRTVTKRCGRFGYENALRKLGDWSDVHSFTSDGKRIKPIQDLEYVEALDRAIEQIADAFGEPYGYVPNFVPFANMYDDHDDF